VGVNSVSFDMPEFTSDETTDTFFRYYLQADQQVYQESHGKDQGLVLFMTLAYIQPDIQYVIRPGGSGDIPDATVLGVQFGASF